MSNFAIHIDADKIRIETKECEIRLDTHKTYQAIKQLYAKADIISYLTDSGFSQAQIESVVDDDFVVRWLSNTANNESIAEALRLSAEYLAEEKGEYADAAK